MKPDGRMEAEERACLNRRAAELAGWTFEVRASVGALGITVYTAAYTKPGGELRVVGLGPDEWVQRAALEAHAPDFVGEPALWWPLVERLVSVTDWQGPLCSRPERTCGEVRYLASWVVMVDGETYVGETAGEVVCVAALAVAEALGLKG